MAKELKLNLPSADDLFSTQEERDDAKREKVVDIPRSEIDSFPDHPFQVKMDDSMMALAESVKAVGIQTPAVVRRNEDGRYEYIAGHRRDMACEMVGLGTIPCIIREMSRDEAVVAMVDSNLQREQILPSEKAKSYKMRYEAMKRQAGRPSKENSAPLGLNYEGKTSRELLADKSPDSHSQIQRYIRLTNLTPELLQMVDNAALGEKPQIAMRPAVELSYLPEECQQTLYESIESEDCTPSHVQAMKMRKFADEGRLNEDVILSIMQEEKPNQAEQFKMPRERISKFFKPGTPVKKIEDTIIKALEIWQKRERSRNDAR
jgi:ParB family chromosome partitioning protein